MTDRAFPAAAPRATASAAPDQLVFGLSSFGDGSLASHGTPLHHAQVLRDLVEQAALADHLGVDAFTLGEHHRADFAVSAPEIVLAAIASRTQRIVLGTGVTVLSSDDPVRVYERFATLDAISSGRAEAFLGRGAFTEPFPLFGYNLKDYEALFNEKLDLFSSLRAEEPITWSGRYRPPLTDQEVFPKTEQPNGVPTWIGVGSSPRSVLRSVHAGFPMMLAVIGGAPERFLPFANLYRETQQETNTDPMPLGIHSPGHIAANDSEAREELWPRWEANRTRIGAERGWDTPTRRSFDEEVESGSLYVGSPDTVAQRIADTVRTLGADRFDLKYSSGGLRHDSLMRSIELYATEVIPRVRALLAAD